MHYLSFSELSSCLNDDPEKLLSYLWTVCPLPPAVLGNSPKAQQSPRCLTWNCRIWKAFSDCALTSSFSHLWHLGKEKNAICFERGLVFFCQAKILEAKKSGGSFNYIPNIQQLLKAMFSFPIPSVVKRIQWVPILNPLDVTPTHWDSQVSSARLTTGIGEVWLRKRNSDQAKLSKLKCPPRALRNWWHLGW